VSEKKKCNAPVEVYSRVCGFFRPVKCWNKGKQEEYEERKNFKITELMGSE
jgi:ribonucleoside-triphosphate reductase